MMMHLHLNMHLPVAALRVRVRVAWQGLILRVACSVSRYVMCCVSGRKNLLHGAVALRASRV